MRGFTELAGSSEGTSTHNLYHSKMEKVLPSESLLDKVKSHNHAKYVNKKEPPNTMYFFVPSAGPENKDKIIIQIVKTSFDGVKQKKTQ